MRFESLLGRNVRAFWGTSYSFGLKLFDQYLLRRLAQGPLNAVVLADHDKVADVWEHLQEGEEYLARQVGRRYVLRGVRLPGGGAFHPKTYLFAGADHATLIVGTGNLTRDGIDHGREVFTSFSTQREEDLASMRAWAAWIGGLVSAQDDELLRRRWNALRETCPWMIGSAEGSDFITNERRSILDQLSDRLPDTVAELRVTAPFFDRDATALDALIKSCDPARLTLYLGAGASVNGPSLASVLGRARDVCLKRFEPRTFVHAKLVGVVGTEGHGALLCGSPNLSRAALTLTYDDSGAGNCETAVIRRGDAEQIRTVFEGSGLTLVDEPLDILNSLQYDEAHPTLARPFVLRSASWREDGRVKLQWHGPTLPQDAALAWTDAAGFALLESDGVTVEPLNERDPLPLIVWLVDTAGKALSNRVVVDDPAALHEALTGSDRKSGSRPSEVEGVEMVPLVRLVLWAHDKFIFDPDDTAAFRRAQVAAGEVTDAEDATDFWERYAAEELQYDPRSQTYKPLTASAAGSTSPVDELLRELQMLLHAAPGASRHQILKVLTPQATEDDGEDTPKEGTPWTMEARQRVRAFNLLMRWSRAVADPRHAFLSPDAPVVNYQTLLGVILLAWLHDALEAKQLRRLLLTLLGAFIGPAHGQGFLGRVTDPDRTTALARLDPLYKEVAAGLVYLALGPKTGWQDDIYDWQPALRRGVEYGVVLSGSLSAAVVERATADAIDQDGVAQLLGQRVDWVDDKTWCQRLNDELDLKSVILDLHRQAKVSAAVIVQGPSEPLHDVRLLTVARRAIDFKHLSAIAVQCGDACTMVFEPGQHARALVDGRVLQSADVVGLTRLREIEHQGGSWADLLDLSTAEAA